MPAPLDSPYFSDSINENSKHHFPTKSVAKPSRPESASLRDGLLIGASDRRSLGDLLRPHIFSKLLSFDSCLCAGLVSKDLSNLGGHKVVNYGEAALEVDPANLSLVHMGGDSLLAGLVSGYHQVAEGKEESRFTSLVQVTAKDEMVGYVKRRSGQNSELAYVLAPKGCYGGSEVMFFGLRLPEPSVLEEEQEEHLVYCAGEASFVGVSGKSAEDFLKDRGVDCQQMPCSLSVISQVCREEIEQRESRAIANLKSEFSNGWIALEVGEIPDYQIEALAECVSKFAIENDYGIVLYSSRHLGSVPADLKRDWLSAFSDESGAVWFESDNIWDLVALIGLSKLYVGSCLDSRIIAGACCVPRINSWRADRRVSDYCDTWEHDSITATLSKDLSTWNGELAEVAKIDQTILVDQFETVANSFYEGVSRSVEASSINGNAGENSSHRDAVLRGKQIAEQELRISQKRKSVSKV